MPRSHQTRSAQRRSARINRPSPEIQGIAGGGMVRGQALPKGIYDESLSLWWVLARTPNKHLPALIWEAQDEGLAAFWPMDRKPAKWRPIMPGAAFIGFHDLGSPEQARDAFFRFIRHAGFTEHVPIHENQVVVGEGTMARFKACLSAYNIGKPLPKALPFEVGDSVTVDLAGRVLDAVIEDLDGESATLRLMQALFGGVDVLRTNARALRIAQGTAQAA